MAGEGSALNDRNVANVANIQFQFPVPNWLLAIGNWQHLHIGNIILISDYCHSTSANEFGCRRSEAEPSASNSSGTSV